MGASYRKVLYKTSTGTFNSLEVFDFMELTVFGEKILVTFE